MQYIIKNYTHTFSGADPGQRFARDDTDILVMRGRDLHTPIAREMQVAQYEPMPPETLRPSEDGEGTDRGRRAQTQTRITIFGY